jgi:aldehyde:ferredoxin oxidoreductase
MIAWHRHYSRFWKQSVLFCDWLFPDFFNVNAPDKEGFTPEAEPRFFNAVTGKKMTFDEGMELGRKVWNLDRSVWILQGRHRDMEVFAEYVYTKPTGHEPHLPGAEPQPYYLPVKENGTWRYGENIGRTIDRDRFEDWKTRYYQFEGWDATNGWPTKKTLESLGLQRVAEELKQNNKLGRG